MRSWVLAQGIGRYSWHRTSRGRFTRAEVVSQSSSLEHVVLVKLGKIRVDHAGYLCTAKTTSCSRTSVNPIHVMISRGVKMCSRRNEFLCERKLPSCHLMFSGSRLTMTVVRRASREHFILAPVTLPRLRHGRTAHRIVSQSIKRHGVGGQHRGLEVFPGPLWCRA